MEGICKRAFTIKVIPGILFWYMCLLFLFSYISKNIIDVFIFLILKNLFFQILSKVLLSICFDFCFHAEIFVIKGLFH